MKIAHIVIAVVEIVLGVFFLLSTKSDIQIGFGLVLLLNGLLAIV